MNNTSKISITTILAVFANLYAGSQNFTLHSPDNKIIVQVINGNQLTYSVNYAGQPLVLPSPLGFEFKNEPAMQSNFEVTGTREQTINETWQPVVKSKHASVQNSCSELQVNLREKEGLMRRMDIFFRAYNDGVAFRYRLYRSEINGNRQITKELTGFQMPGSPKAWVVEYEKGYSSSQESEFWPRELSYMKKSTKAGLPFLIEANKNVYAAITEANIDNYPGFYLGASDEKDDNSITLVTKLAPLPGEKEDGVKARFADKLLSPWRVIMVASTPGKLIESEIIQNLNEPCKIKDPSWIKPGLSAWDHWWSGEVKVDMETIKKYIDLASTEGWPYMLIDWQWYGPFNKPEADITKPAPQLNMPKLLRYAKSKDVRLWLWLYNSDVNRNNNFEKAFALYEKWGIAGIKIDFMDRDDQDMVNWYHEIIQTAANHHLMVDFHGAYKPDGIIRTYPNMITREGVMGEEYYKFSNRVTPEHNVTLPFTRMLAGQMDYTPGGFLNVTKEQFSQRTPAVSMNTRCAELAKFVVYESPFMVYCDHPNHIYNQPGEDFLRIVPTVWDDIKVLGGYPGEYVALAKRTGNKWFIGAMNNSTEKTITIKADFLPAGKYQLETWADAEDANTNPTRLSKSKTTITAGQTLKIKMAIGGGYTGYIVPAKS